MAYSGSTAASTVANPPRLLIPRLGGLPNSTELSTAVGTNPYREQGGALWYYSSSDPPATVTASGYFTDARELGMRPGDIVMGIGWTTLGSSVHMFIAPVFAVSTNGAEISTAGYVSTT